MAGRGLFSSVPVVRESCTGLQVKVSHISYHTFNAMRTSNFFFNGQNEKWMNNLVRKSTLLSGVAEKQRNQFFKNLYKKVDDLLEYLQENG